jgi:hypothetical protein
LDLGVLDIPSWNRLVFENDFVLVVCIVKLVVYFAVSAGYLRVTGRLQNTHLVCALAMELNIKYLATVIY